MINYGATQLTQEESKQREVNHNIAQDVENAGTGLDGASQA